MSASLKVRWRGAVYEIATCLTPERAQLAAALWPDGVVDLARVLEPGRPDTFSQAERKGLVKMALRALGELEHRTSVLGSGEARTVAVRGTFGTTAKRKVAAARPARRRIDHAFVTALLEQQKPAPAPREGFAVKAVSL